MAITKEREGLIDAPGGRIWYRVAGDGPGVPLLVLHGGPGAGHDYLEPLQVLGDERPVVFYDQLGCGKSDIPSDTSLFTPEHFAREVQVVRDVLRLDRIHLLGQSWGGWLLLEYMAAKPDGIVSLTLASTSADIQSFLDAVPGLLAQLPQDAQDTITRCEADGTTTSPEYIAATFAFYQKFLCRMPVWPESMLRTGVNIQNTPVYHHMWGPSEFTLTGTLEGWDRRNVLDEIDVPTLITVGRYDEIVPSISEAMHKRIKGSELVIFEDSAHSAHTEEAEKYAAVLRDFMRRAEAKT
ncbi:MAG: proline iminopeptidase-family hydrolase [Chloroflexota bacterium]